MKQYLKICVLLFMCLFFVSLTAWAQEPVEATSQNATAEYTNKPPIIDGEIDKVWETTPFYYAMHRENTSEVGEKSKVNPIEGSYAKILWDEKHYYLLGVVYDTTLSEAGFTDWNSVDFWISEKNTQVYGWDEDEGDYCYCITDDGTQVVQQHKDGSKVYGKEFDGSKQSVVNYGDHYVVEIKIPWQSDVVVESGDEIGFTVSFNDDMDGDGERDAYTYWASERNGKYWSNTNALVSVELVRQTVHVNPFVIVGAIAGVLVACGVVCVICVNVRKKKRCML